MLTASIVSTGWAGAASSLKTRLKVRTYHVARHGGTLLAVQTILVAAVVLASARGWEALGLLILIASCHLSFQVNDLGRSMGNAQASQFWITLLESISVGFLTSAVLFQVWPILVPRLGLAFATAGVMAILPAISRATLRALIRRGKCRETILIAGAEDLADKLYHALGAGASGLDDDLDERALAVDFTELGALVGQYKSPRVVIAELDNVNRERLAAELLDARLRGVPVMDAVDFYEERTGKIWLEGLTPQWFLHTNGFAHSKTSLRIKRIFDIAAALLMIVLASPLLALVALAIKLDSRGPVLFKQIRVGLNGKIFVIYKFRSMRHDSEGESNPSWTAEKDDRVTRVGRVLRVFRLDEIPQAFNVLKGDMSMVGPRPERPCFVKWLRQTIPFYDLRHYLKPGITGWAQVMFSYGASVEDSYEKLQYDLYYAKHRTLRCEVGIVLKTVRTVLFGRGR